MSEAAKKLSPTQQELLDAIRRGARVRYITGVDAYCYRSDTMKACTRTALALEDKGFLKRIKEDWRGYEFVAAKG